MKLGSIYCAPSLERTKNKTLALELVAANRFLFLVLVFFLCHYAVLPAAEIPTEARLATFSLRGCFNFLGV
jgi:hypothetical protein